MKKVFLIVIALLFYFQAGFSQIKLGTTQADLPIILLAKGVSLHIVSPEPIQYADIPPQRVTGDLPLKNIVRIKIVGDSTHFSSQDDDIGILTIVGESFMAQYRLKSVPRFDQIITNTQFDILPEHMKPISMPGINLSTPEMEKHAMSILTSHGSKRIRKARGYGLKATLNHIYTIGNDVFLDITYTNDTNLAYEIDELRFKIDDRKIMKATNSQSIEIKPIWQLYPFGTFKKTFRNVYVLKKVTFPENKLLKIEITEKQISGRSLILPVKYSDILQADTF
jgi:conjugative transposon TraN protein